MTSLLSAIKPIKKLYETESQYNGHVEVLEVGRTKKIKVDGIDQSLNHEAPSCSKLVWGKAVALLKKLEPELNNVLILGLGGGTMAHLISRQFNSPEIVSVELDPVMIDIAKRFFDIEKIPNHRIINDDALRVVVSPEEFDIQPKSFQALIVDIYVGDKYPDLGKSGNFISSLKNLVSPGGLIIFNRIYIEKHQDDVNLFCDTLEDFLLDVNTEIVAGYTNSDNVLIYGRV